MNLRMFIEKLAILQQHPIHSPKDGAEQALAKYFHHFFSDLQKHEVANSTVGLRGHFIESELPALINEGIEKLAVSRDELSEKIKYLYCLHLSLPIVSLERLEATNGHPQKFARPNLVAVIERLIEDTVSACAARRVVNYLNAPLNALRYCFDGFLRDVYRNGLNAIIDANASKSREHYGHFGRTTLSTDISTGEVRITFTHRSSRPYHGITPERLKVRFCVQDNERGSSPTFHGCDVDLKTALAMIEDVRTHWPPDAKTRRSKLIAYLPPTCS